MQTTAVESADRARTAAVIAEECRAVAEMLIKKNKAYGNSALDPVRIFSKASPEEQLRVRIDDKLSRLARGQAAGEDVELDLIGYLILLRVQRRMASAGVGQEVGLQWRPEGSPSWTR